MMLLISALRIQTTNPFYTIQLTDLEKDLAAAEAGGRHTILIYKDIHLSFEDFFSEEYYNAIAGKSTLSSVYSARDRTQIIQGEDIRVLFSVDNR